MIYFPVVDVYQKWCGPCKAVQYLFRKLRTEYGDDVLRFAVVSSSKPGNNGFSFLLLQLRQMGKNYVSHFDKL